MRRSASGQAPPAIVIYDGECSVCDALRRAVERRDRQGRLVFVPFQRVDLEGISPGLTREMAARSVYLVQPGRGGRFHGARAVFEALKRLPGYWGWLGAVWSFPVLSLLAEPFYRLVARNRGRISRWLSLPPPAPLDTFPRQE